jgi:hypothetical protein
MNAVSSHKVENQPQAKSVQSQGKPFGGNFFVLDWVLLCSHTFPPVQPGSFRPLHVASAARRSCNYIASSRNPHPKVCL